MSKGIVISLYDFTGEALKPWALAGYTCYAFDIQHSKQNLNTDTFVGSKGSINYIHADLHSFDGFIDVMRAVNNKPVVFGMAFPVCTDMAVSGAAHFKRKAERDPDFQTKAVRYAKHCADFFTSYDIPYFIENPVSVLATMWRKPDYYFHPWQYGGYIPDDEAYHPRWPEYIAPYDGYPKKTCLWTGGGFKMPSQRHAYIPHGGYSKQHLKLGGKSQRTKDIRSATPRGFAIAVHHANTLN